MQVNKLQNLGHVPGLTNTDYRAVDAVSSTGVVKLVQSTPAHYQAYLTQQREPTEAMVFGTAIHQAILEPELFKNNYVCKPEGMSFATVEGKAWKADNKNKSIVTFEQWVAINGICNSVASHPQVRRILQNAKMEQSYFWQDPATGLLCKCRPDAFDGSVVIDIKTTESASPRNFQNSIAKYGYHIQSAFYLEGLSNISGKNLTDFVHVVVEKEAPYAISCYVLDDASLDKARGDISLALNKIASCKQADEWPGYSNDLQTMNLPHYMWGEE